MAHESRKPAADRGCGYADQQQRVACDIVGLSVPQDHERNTQQHEHNPKLNAVEEPAERVFELGLQRFEVTASRFPFEKSDKLLVAREAVEQPRVKVCNSFTGTAAANVDGEHPDAPAEDARAGETVSVIVRFSFISVAVPLSNSQTPFGHYRSR